MPQWLICLLLFLLKLSPFFAVLVSHPTSPTYPFKSEGTLWLILHFCVKSCVFTDWLPLCYCPHSAHFYGKILAHLWGCEYSLETHPSEQCIQSENARIFRFSCLLVTLFLFIVILEPTYTYGKAILCNDIFASDEAILGST